MTLKERKIKMRFVELDVFPSPRETETKKMLVNVDGIFFMTEVNVPTPVVEADGSQAAKLGTLISSSGGNGLLVDMLVEDVYKMVLGHTEGLPLKEKQDGNSKPASKHKKGVRKGSKV